MRLKKTIHIDLTKLASKVNVVLLRDVLIPDKYQAMVRERLPDAIDFVTGKPSSDIDIPNFDPAAKLFQSHSLTPLYAASASHHLCIAPPLHRACLVIKSQLREELLSDPVSCFVFGVWCFVFSTV